MNAKTLAVTSKGRITIPSAMRRALGFHEGVRLTITLDGDEVRIRRAGSVVERTAGMFKGNETPLPAEELRIIAERAIADDVVQRGSV